LVYRSTFWHSHIKKYHVICLYLYIVLKVKYFHQENFCTVVASTGASCAPSYTSVYIVCIIKRSEYRFSYIGSLTSEILATSVLSHYVVTVASTTHSLSLPCLSYTITTYILEFVIGIKHRKFFIFFNLNNYLFSVALSQENYHSHM
jgi:hypothetical protein